jgi:hypothetical protein
VFSFYRVVLFILHYISLSFFIQEQSTCRHNGHASGRYKLKSIRIILLKLSQSDRTNSSTVLLANAGA